MATLRGTESPIKVRAVADVAGRSSGPAPLAPYRAVVPVKQVSYAASKRALDVVVAIAALILFSPILLLVAVLVKLTSRGPVIFKQTRVGLGGEYFTCYKFRSMQEDAEEHRDKLVHLNEMTGPVFKIRNDPRLTPIGKWLRKFSLDELPQFYNVLRGDMSIVGPRPPVPCEVVHYGPRELGRLAIKPGLTCLWQISGRNNIPFERWIALDLLYVQTMSFWKDIAIIIKTVPAVITCRGAH